MRLAILSDIHANLPALEAALAEAQARQADRLVFLGDLVGYGPDPEAVVARVRDLADGGAMIIRGNHDDAAVHETDDMSPTAAAAMRWTRNQLSSDAKAFLDRLPLQERLGSCLFVHADASQPERWHYVTDAESAYASLIADGAHVTFCGHVHVPALYCLSPAGKIVAHAPVTGVPVPLNTQRKWLGVVGSVGQPRDGNPAAALAFYDTAARELTFARAPYDVEGVAQRILAAGLPEKLATRLLRGT